MDIRNCYSAKERAERISEYEKREKLIRKFVSEKRELSKRLCPDDDFDESCDAEDIFNHGRGQGMFEVCFALEKILADTRLSSGKKYTQGNKDDIEQAVRCLDDFTHNWCMNCALTETENDLIFRCKECPFLTDGDKCLIKVFKNKKLPKYKNFGCMRWN